MIRIYYSMLQLLLVLNGTLWDDTDCSSYASRKLWNRRKCILQSQSLNMWEWNYILIAHLCVHCALLLIITSDEDAACWDHYSFKRLWNCFCDMIRYGIMIITILLLLHKRKKDKQSWCFWLSNMLFYTYIFTTHKGSFFFLWAWS